MGSSISTSSPPEAFDERGHTLPLNPMECEKNSGGGFVAVCSNVVVLFKYFKYFMGRKRQ
jgi:hypothetical protein